MDNTDHLKLVGDDGRVPRNWSIDAIWTKKLGKPFTPISVYFIDNHHRLKYPITPIEFALIVNLFRHKWDERSPYPSMPLLAKRMGRSPQSVRKAARDLEGKGYLKREMFMGFPNNFDLTPLFAALERLFDEDKAAAAAKAKKTGSRRRTYRTG